VLVAISVFFFFFSTIMFFIMVIGQRKIDEFSEMPGAH
jgi:hypothetical protein